MRIERRLPGFAIVVLGSLTVSSAAPPAVTAAVEGAVGLALEIEDGVGVPLRVRAGQEFFVDQIDLRASLRSGADEGVAGLAGSGDFADLDWRGVALADQEFVGLPNADGTSIGRPQAR